VSDIITSSAQDRTALAVYMCYVSETGLGQARSALLGAKLNMGYCTNYWHAGILCACVQGGQSSTQYSVAMQDSRQDRQDDAEGQGLESPDCYGVCSRG